MKNNLKFIAVSIFTTLFIIVSLVFAASVTTVSPNGGYINTSQTYTFNFTIDTTSQNITEIIVNTTGTVTNITQIFVVGSNNTNATGTTFTSDESREMLNWTASTPLNGTFWFSFDFNIPDTSAGAFNITIFVDGLLINVTQFTADNDTPIAFINSVNGFAVSGNYTNNSTLTINFTARDTYINNWNLSLFNLTGALVNSWSGNNNVSDVVSHLVSNDGIYFINITAVDLAGKVTTSSTFNITVDTIAPSISFNNPTTFSGSYSQNWISANITATDSYLKTITIYLYNSTGLIGSPSCPSSPCFYNFTELPDGTYYLNATTIDLAGNENVTTTQTILLDTTPPTTSASAKDDTGATYTFGTWTSSSYINVTLSCDDGSGSGCDVILYCTDTTNACTPSSIYSTLAQVTTEGISYIRFRANDTTGNLESIKSEVIKIDTTPPTTTDDAPVGWQSSAFNITLTCSDSGSGCNLTQYRIDGGSWQNGTIVEITTDGNHTVEYNSIDNVGNIETINTVYAALDTTPPIINITPTDFTDVSSAQITFVIPISDVLVGVDESTVRLYINSSDNSATSTAYTMTYDPSTGNATLVLSLDITSPFLSPGPHWIKVCANDTIGNENCTWSPSPYIIKIVSASQLESLVKNNLSLDAFNITYENGTDVGLGTNIPAMNPVEYNYTIHFSKNGFEAFIYGMQINETLAAQMINNNFTLDLPSMEATIQNLTSGITDIVSVWVDVSSYLPTKSFYKYGEIVLNDTYDAVFYCSTPTNCTQISICNATEVNLSNYATVIPNESACYINNVSGDDKTHIYVDHFSGGAGAKDTTAPTITFSCSPTVGYIGYTITCSCTATDNVDSSPTVSYTVHPSTNSRGTFTTTCTAIDDAGNTATKSIQYDVLSSSGGGGTAPQTPPRHIFILSTIEEGKEVIMNIANEEIGIKEIRIKVRNEIKDAKITVTKLIEKPNVKDAPGKIYQYLKIDTQNVNEYLEEAKIQFKVEKQWLTDNNLDKNLVVLYRFDETEWQKLDTSIIEETNDYVIYEAVTPGFSYFAIGTEEKVCEEGEKRCFDDNLEQCIDNSWVIVETCEYGCNSTTLTCNAAPGQPTEKVEKVCEEGEKRCSGNELQECKDNSWVTVEVCEYGCGTEELKCKSAPTKIPYWIIIIIVIILGVIYCIYRKIISISNQFSYSSS